MSNHRREKLDMVFLLGVLDTEEARVGAITLGHVVETSGISDVQALHLIADTMRQLGMPTDIAVNGKPLSTESYIQRTDAAGKWRQPIESEGLTFRFGKVPAFKHAFVSIEEIQPGLATHWEDWLTPFLSVNGFVQAWISDVEYEYWQNAKDPLLYQAAGRSFDHLPTKSNGLPPPLERLEIDTSNNPGRWLFHVGFIEAVGSTMWLSPFFWSLVGVSRKEILFSTSEFDVRNLPNGITQVKVADHCFRDGDNHEVQCKLRSILFKDYDDSALKK